MLTAAEGDALIGKLAALPSQIEAAVNGLNDLQLNTPYRDGGWTVRQVVHHLADSHMNAYIRMRRMLTEDNPTLKPYDQDEWAKLPDSKLPLASSLAILRGLHERWVALLKSVPDSAMSRTARHPERGEVTFEGTLKTYAGHGEKHLEHIMGLRRAKGW